MIVIGADTHKRSHTCAAVDAAVGEVVAGKTATAAPGWLRSAARVGALARSGARVGA